jgi:hypothetical protein
MSKADTGQEKTERLMKQAHLPGPSETLKARVTAAALNAWNRDEASVPVRVVAFRRLADYAADLRWMLDCTKQSTVPFDPNETEAFDKRYSEIDKRHALTGILIARHGPSQSDVPEHDRGYPHHRSRIGFAAIQNHKRQLTRDAGRA